MKKIYILLMACAVMAACKRTEVDFTYSPEKPKAGQSITFSNLSSGGEEWAWTFGDGTTSSLKAPTHTYKQPGTYRVILKVDNKSSLTTTKEITVYDTVPSFSCSDSVFQIFQDYTFYAQVYNPYNYTVTYEWSFPINMIYAHLSDTTASMTDEAITLYFSKAMDQAPLELRVILNGDTTRIMRNFKIADKTTNSVLFRTKQGDYRQRIFGARAEEAKMDSSAKDLLNASQDTMQVYNGETFKLSELKKIFPNLEGFHIANRKIYARMKDDGLDGLWVANINGDNQVQIDTLLCEAMALDMTDNRIYWANENGVYYMPLIGSDNNKFVTTPIQLNQLTNVTKMACDATRR